MSAMDRPEDAVGFLATSFKSKVFELSAVVFSHLSLHNESNLVGLLTILRLRTRGYTLVRRS
jgi:hypothetical protein